jgi:hypothetical protein
MVFVADEIPQELRRVVEFLNGQMDPAEVLAVEVKQYAGQARLKTLVPRLVGQTAASITRKGRTPAKAAKTDEASFLNEMQQSRGPEECGAARQVIEWAKQQGLTPNFSKTHKSASFIPTVDTPGAPRFPVSLNTGGNVWIQMRWLRDSTPFKDEAKRQVLGQKLNEIPGVKVPPERMTGYPGIPLQALKNEAALQALLATLTWMVKELRTTPAE